MSECDRFELEAAAYAEGSLDPEGEARMRIHARTCPDCRRRLAEVEELLAGAAAVRGDIRAVMDTIDWEALPDAITAKAFGGRGPGLEPGIRFRRTRPWINKTGEYATERSRRPFGRQRDLWARLWGLPWGPALAAVLTGIILGAGGMFFLLHPRAVFNGTSSGYFVSGEVIDRAEFQLAKQETLDYLDRSQTLLLDLIQNGRGQPQSLPRAQTIESARALVAKKRYLNSQLESVPLAKAQAICDQIEVLFLELTRIGEDLSPAEAAQIRDYIEKKQLLLKIKLLRSELAGSEV